MNNGEENFHQIDYGGAIKIEKWFDGNVKAFCWGCIFNDVSDENNIEIFMRLFNKTFKIIHSPLNNIGYDGKLNPLHSIWGWVHNKDSQYHPS